MNAILRDAQLSMMRRISPSINLYEFKLADGLPLADCGPGGHIDLHFPSGLVRQYSLIEVRADTFLLAVQQEVESRGASRYLHHSVRLGERFQIGLPRNHFRLSVDAPHSVFLAGGIGLTPILPMLARLTASNRSWELHYSSRHSPPPFLELLEGYGSQVKLATGTGGARAFDMASVIDRAPEGAVFYCCGPQRMLEYFEDATSSLPEERARIERFAPATALSSERGFVVHLKKSGRSVSISPGQTILQGLAEAGVQAPSSCQEGVCGACETRVLHGRPDHRDSILSTAERAGNKTMMICCSGSLDSELVLDL